ncbi:hypothetical protein [Gymnodinialimonas sp.]
MTYSVAVFDTVEALLVSQKPPKQDKALLGMDDYVIMLSMDCALAMDDVRTRLKDRMKLARG